MGVLGDKLAALSVEIEKAVADVNGSVEALQAEIKTVAPAVLSHVKGFGADLVGLKVNIQGQVKKLEAEIDKLTR